MTWRSSCRAWSTCPGAWPRLQLSATRALYRGPEGSGGDLFGCSDMGAQRVDSLGTHVSVRNRPERPVPSAQPPPSPGAVCVLGGGNASSAFDALPLEHLVQRIHEPIQDRDLASATPASARRTANAWAPRGGGLRPTLREVPVRVEALAVLAGLRPGRSPRAAWPCYFGKPGYIRAEYVGDCRPRGVRGARARKLLASGQ